MPDETRFTTLQQQIRTLDADVQDLTINAQLHYQSVCYAPRSLQNKIEKLRERQRKAEHKLFDLLTRVSPRDWTRGVPCWYIWRKLTWQDAITADALSVVPPPAFQHTPQDAARFAAALPSPGMLAPVSTLASRSTSGISKGSPRAAQSRAERERERIPNGQIAACRS